MFRRSFGIACFTGLLVAAPVFGQNQQIEGLLKKGEALLDNLPEIPADYDKDFYYKIEANEKPIGWYHIKLDTVTKDGERYYRFRERYGLNSVKLGYRDGEMRVIMDRKWKPIDIRNRMESITAPGGQRHVKDRAGIKNGKFQRRYFDGRQTKKFKFEYGDVNAVYLCDPLFGQLKMEPGQWFALTTYDVERGVFDTLAYRVEKKKKDGMTKVRMYEIVSVEDPSKMKDTDFTITNPPPIDEEEKKQEDMDEKERKAAEAKEYYMLIDDDDSIRFINIPIGKITVRRVDKERVEEVKKEIAIHESDIPVT